MWLAEPVFTKLISALQLFVKNSYIECHRNPTESLGTSTKSRVDGRGHIKHPFFPLLHKECLKSQNTSFVLLLKEVKLDVLLAHFQF